MNSEHIGLVWVAFRILPVLECLQDKKNILLCYNK